MKTDQNNSAIPWTRASWTAFIVVITAIYWRTLKAPFIYDDKIEAAGTRSIRSLEEWEALLSYNPSRVLLQLSYALNFNQSGLSTFDYHVTNVVIHAMSVGAALWLVSTLNDIRKKPLPPWTSALTVGLWALHPMATESVSYITGRSESLTALFCFMSCAAWATALRRESDKKRGWHWRSLGVLACLMGMLSKEIGIMCPFVLLAMELSLSEGKWRQIRWPAHLPLLGLVMAGAALRLSAVEWSLESVIPKESDRGMAVQLTTQAEAWLRYGGLWLFPKDQTIYHHLTDVEPGSWRGLIVIIGWISVIIAAWKATSKAPTARWALLAGCLFLLPSSSFAPLKENMAEHRAHQMGFWLFVAFVHSTPGIWNRSKGKWAFILLPTLAIITYDRNAAWESEVAIWQDAVKKNPSNGEAFYALGDAFRFATPPSREAAEFSYIESVKLSPKNLDAWNNLGLVRAEMGKQKSAEDTWKKVLSIKDGRCGDGGPIPCKCKARNNLGKLNGQQGKFTVAKKHLESALIMCPQNIYTHYFLGELYRQGPLFNKSRALDHLGAVLKLDPEFAKSEAIQESIDQLTF